MSHCRYVHCAVHIVDESPALLSVYTYLLTLFSIYLKNAITVAIIVNWVPAAGCQRDIR